MKIGTIEQAVSLYGFEQRLVDLREYGVDDMFAELDELGVKKFELIGSMVFDQYPRPKASEIDAVVRAAERHGVTPFSYGGYIDLGRITGHDATDAEIMLDVTADLMTARDLGVRYLRAGAIPVHLLHQSAAMAERYGIRIGIEVHAPSKPSDANIQKLLATMDEIDSPYLGLVPDFGCFIERPAQPALDRHLANGAKPELLDYVIEHRHGGLDEPGMQAKIAEMGGGEAEKIAISEFFGFLSFGPADVEGFKTLLHRTQYFHSKFYHVTEDLQDPQIPVDRLLAAIVESGFEGVLLSEYEGHAFHLDDAHEQLERHLRLEQKILKQLAG
ncbi:TIM barrel protein [Streptomyces sp. NPDC047000]|uniref:sugar phosphate isomerase/epimerase family protein n=1 Tax=Streptomyces sp. NPDC047000 TaxID=3155474 RepID=UPI0033C03814